MKKHLKKVLALLLIATSFSVLPMIGTSSSGIITFAENEAEQNQKVRRKKGSVCIEGTPFCIEEKIYDENPSLFSKNSLNQIFQNSKNKIFKGLGLNYTDEIPTHVYVKENLHERRILGRSSFDRIEIKKDALFDNEILSHEMTHSLLGDSSIEHDYTLNLGINEGLATQNEKLGYYNPILLSLWLKLKLPNECFGKKYPYDDDLNRKFYSIHQYMVHDWIKSEGKDIVKNWLEKVEKGEDSVKAFLDLGGDKIAKKYHCTIVTPETSIFKRFLLNISPHSLIYMFSGFLGFMLRLKFRR